MLNCLVRCDPDCRQLRLFRFQYGRYFQRLGESPEIVRNDEISVADLIKLRPRAIVISLGPCTPSEAGISTAIIREHSGRIPILGICLGHQCVGSVFGGRVTRTLRPMHSRSSRIMHEGGQLFDGLPSPLSVGSYHSLVIELDQTCARDLMVTARSRNARSWPSHTTVIQPTACSFIQNRYSLNMGTCC